MTIVETEDTLHGKPRIEGHRIGVHHVYFSYLQGKSVEEIAEATYPTINEEQVEEAIEYFEENAEEIILDLLASDFNLLEFLFEDDVKGENSLESNLKHLEEKSKLYRNALEEAESDE